MLLLENVKLHMWFIFVAHIIYFLYLVSAGLENVFIIKGLASVTCIDAVTLRSWFCKNIT